MDETCVIHVLVSCPVVITRQDFFCLHVIFSGYLLNFAEVTRKSNGSWTAVAEILPLYITYTFAERPDAKTGTFQNVGIFSAGYAMRLS